MTLREVADEALPADNVRGSLSDLCVEDREGDTVVSAGHKGGLLTLVESKTQLAKIIRLPRATAHATQRAAVRRLKPIGDFVHTITFDNGKEFAAHQDIAHALKTKIFFATPYHAWERGLNDKFRDFFPKGTDFSTIANPQGCQGRRLLNARPRKSLGFRSPQEVFDSSLTTISDLRNERLQHKDTHSCAQGTYAMAPGALVRQQASRALDFSQQARS